MAQGTHERFVAANCELRGFLQQTERLADGSGTMPEQDLEKVRARLLNLTAEVGDAARSETLDTDLRSEFAEYVDNLRALQTAIETICR